MKDKQHKDKKRHYLPAATIGYFSANTSPEQLRERLVWVLRKNSNTPRLDVAENVGFSKLIYGYGKGELFDLDGYFKSAEVWFHQPVDRIMASNSSCVCDHLNEAHTQFVWCVKKPGSASGGVFET